MLLAGSLSRRQPSARIVGREWPIVIRRLRRPVARRLFEDVADSRSARLGGGVETILQTPTGVWSDELNTAR